MKTKAKKCKRAVILAAGKGTRVRAIATQTPKCLMQLGKRRIIEWIIEAITLAGLKEITIVTGFGARAIRNALKDGNHLGANIEYVHNSRWHEPNGVSLYSVKATVGTQENFLTLMSDHLLPPEIIRKVAAARTTKCVLAVDTNIEGVFDLPDATKVRISDGVPVAIGKHLRKYNAVDCGLFRFDRRIFIALENAFRMGRKALTDGVRLLIENGDLAVLPIGTNSTWIDIDTPSAYRKALREIDLLIPRSRRKRG